MTIVTGLADPVSNFVILVADSRITGVADGAHFDVCQKIVHLGSHGVFGFAGPIKAAATTAGWISGTFKKLGPAWLTDELGVIGMLQDIGVLGQPGGNSFLAAFMDERNHATLVRFSTDGDYNLTRAGIEMIGSGAETYDVIRPKMTDIMNFGTAGQGGIDVGNRAFVLSDMIVREAKARSVESVGGLMQIHFIERDGNRAVPYERWVNIDEVYGTYVKMDIDAAGYWVQLHEPTGLEVRLRFPGEADFGEEGGNFEIERLLDRNSPGVQRRPNPVLQYKPYLSDSGEWLLRTSGDT